MIWSLYPTDDDREEVARQAADHGGVVFTSLHMPEARDLPAFLDVLADLHRRYGLTWWADVSPVVVDLLGPRLRECGVVGLRHDFGFGPDEIHRIARETGLRTAVNASTIDAATLDALADLEPVGWHNFHPRPGTGITTRWCLEQSRMFTDRGLELVGFIPGERGLRAPFHRGLPTLEHHRHRNAWVNLVELSRMGMTVALAEGTLAEETLGWIDRMESDGVVTLPLADLACPELAGVRTLRREDTGTSWRIDGTRGMSVPDAPNGGCRRAGSLQMDTLGRYRGEVHLMRCDEPLDADFVRVGEVAGPWVGIVDALCGGDLVELVPWTSAAGGIGP